MCDIVIAEMVFSFSYTKRTSSSIFLIIRRHLLVGMAKGTCKKNIVRAKKKSWAQSVRMFSIWHHYKVGTGSSVVSQSPCFSRNLFTRYLARHGIGDKAFYWVEGALVPALPASYLFDHENI